MLIDLHISNLKIGDNVYYMANQQDITNVRKEINNIGYGFVYGGMDVGDSYGMTNIGRFLSGVLVAMEQSLNKKVKLTITNTNPLTASPVLVYQDSHVSTYFPRFIAGRIYESDGTPILPVIQ